MAKCLVEKLQTARNKQSVMARAGFPCQLDFDLNFKLIFRAIFQPIILYCALVWKCHIKKKQIAQNRQSLMTSDMQELTSSLSI